MTITTGAARRSPDRPPRESSCFLPLTVPPRQSLPVHHDVDAEQRERACHGAEDENQQSRTERRDRILGTGAGNRHVVARLVDPHADCLSRAAAALETHSADVLDAVVLPLSKNRVEMRRRLGRRVGDRYVVRIVENDRRPDAEPMVVQTGSTAATEGPR